MSKIKLAKLKLMLSVFCFLVLQTFNAVKASPSSQTFKAITDSVVLTGNSTWKLVKSTQDVKVYTKEIDCIDESNGISMKKVFIKIENLTSSVIAIEWDNKLRYNTGYVNSDGNSDEQHMRVVVEASSMVEGICSKNNALAIYAGMIGIASEKLLSFQFLNFSIFK